MPSPSYDISHYISLGLSESDAIEIVSKNKELTGHGIRLRRAKNRIVRYGYIDMTIEQLFELEYKITSTGFIATNKLPMVHKVITAVMRNRNLSWQDAVSFILEIIHKKEVNLSFKSTILIETLYGKDSEEYALKLELNKKAASCSFEKFSERYDDKDLAYKEFCITYGSNNKEHIKRKHNVSDDEANAIKSERKHKCAKTRDSWKPEYRESVYKTRGLTLENCVRKHGPEMGIIVYNERLAKRKALTGQPYYIKRYGEEEGKRLYNENRRNRNTFLWCVEYWVRLGYSEVESREILKEYFSKRPRFSKSLCIERYGEEEGIRIWKARTDLWQRTLNSRPQEEIDRANKTKGITLENMIRKHGEEEGSIRYNKWKESLNINIGGSVSKISIRFFDSLLSALHDIGIDLQPSDYTYGKDGMKEYYIRTKNGIRFYDFVLHKHKIIIEFNGNVFHPRQGDENWVSVFGAPYKTVWENDVVKYDAAVEKGFTVFYVWDDMDMDMQRDQMMVEILNVQKEIE